MVGYAIPTKYRLRRRRPIKKKPALPPAFTGHKNLDNYFFGGAMASFTALAT